jgi:signal transduction histidine kinase
MELGDLEDLHVTVERFPVARRALAEGRVHEIDGAEGLDLPDVWREFLAGMHTIWTPMSAGGRWVGVIISERQPGEPPIGDSERQLLLTLGRTAAVAAVARVATTVSEKAKQLEQRIDLAREIHESVMQRLFGVSLALAAEEQLGPEAQRRCAEELQAALGELRAALQRPLGRAPRPTATTLANELERMAVVHPDLGVRLTAGDPTAVPDHLQALSQSVLAEAIRNAQKHARPTCVSVSVAHAAGAFVLEITNDGLLTVDPKASGGVGLRLAALEALGCGGVVEFGPREDSWQVRLVVPDADDPAPAAGEERPRRPRGASAHSEVLG